MIGCSFRWESCPDCFDEDMENVKCGIFSKRVPGALSPEEKEEKEKEKEKEREEKENER